MSLKRLQLDYLDLYLIHLPFGFICDEATLTPLVHDGVFQIDPGTDHVATWKVRKYDKFNKAKRIQANLPTIEYMIQNVNERVR